MTESQLKRHYARFNKKYFDGKLPADVAIKFVDMSGSNDGGLCVSLSHDGLQLHTIYLDSNFKEYDTVIEWFLLHEMCHLKLFNQLPAETDPHGQQFDEEMLRLAFRGAFRGRW